MNHMKGNSLFDSISGLLKDNKENIDSTLAGWVSELETCIRKVRVDKDLFHQWSPLRICISLVGVKTRKPKFSVRFLGQEVGNIIVDNGTVRLCISSRHYKNNQAWFARHHPKGSGDFGLPPGKYEWKMAEAKNFRRDFKDVKANLHVKTGIPEHRIESAFIEEMESGRKSKFDGMVGPILPVKVANCPLQFPLPLSASKGYPVLQFGHIDILARRGYPRNVKLSVWELKSPGVLSHAVEQAYIYALTLRHILKSPHGKEWYKLCGFTSNVPAKLHIEAVVAITEDKKKAFQKQYEHLIAENPLRIDGDQISFFVALYDGVTYKITSFERLKGTAAPE